MKIHLPNFKKNNILIVGDIILDRYWYGIVNRISPEAPVPIIKIKKKKEKLGGAANVAANAAQLGNKVHLIGFIGKDKESEILKKKLIQNKIKFNLIELSTHKTITKTRILSNNQHIIRFDIEEKFENINKNTMLKYIEKKIKKSNALILSDYEKGTLTEINKIIKIANLFNIPIFIDPKGDNFNNYYNATILTPNISEFERVVGKCKNNIDIEKKGINLINKLNLKALLITRSEKGMTLIEIGKKALHLSAETKKAFHVIGAGDTVIAVFSCSNVTKLNFHQSSILSNIAAGIVVSEKKQSIISYNKLKKAIKCKNTKFKYQNTF